MDSRKTKAKHYVKTADHKCIAQVMAVAEKGGFRIYVAWEWKAMADKGVFGFIKSRSLYGMITEDAVKETADYGLDIGGSGEEKLVFKNLF
jgi:hypothetical protein